MNPNLQILVLTWQARAAKNRSYSRMRETSTQNASYQEGLAKAYSSCAEELRRFLEEVASYDDRINSPHPDTP